MLKKTAILAGVASFVALLALPSGAAASWKDSGVNLANNAVIGLTGTYRVEGGGGGFECQITSRVTLEPGTTGKMETFVPHPLNETENCDQKDDTGACVIHDVTPMNLPWTIHTATASTISITMGAITATTTGLFCITDHVMSTPNTITATPDQTIGMSSVALGGNLQYDERTPSTGTVHKRAAGVSGTLTIEGTNKLTYDL